jgi:coenzyme F420 biosynthesis associated uncharacterized protein
MTTEMVDWDLAVSLGSRLAGAGPEVSAEEAEATVAELREGAERSTSYVRDFTGLDAGALTAPVLVVDRPAWIRANAEGFAQLLTPVIEKVTEKKGPPGPITLAVGSRITGAEVGGLLGFMSSRVLGQFDPFHEPTGRLLLVAPNVVHVERELEVDPTDFGSGCACTRRPTGCSSPRRRGCATTSSPRSDASPRPSSRSERRPQADLRGDQERWQGGAWSI